MLVLLPGLEQVTAPTACLPAMIGRRKLAARSLDPAGSPPDNMLSWAWACQDDPQGRHSLEACGAPRMGPGAPAGGPSARQCCEGCHSTVQLGSLQKVGQSSLCTVAPATRTVALQYSTVRYRTGRRIRSKYKGLLYGKSTATVRYCRSRGEAMKHIF